MIEALKIIAEMGSPCAFSIIGVSAAIAVPLMVRRGMQNQERIEELRLKRAIQLEQFKKGALMIGEGPSGS